MTPQLHKALIEIEAAIIALYDLDAGAKLEIIGLRDMEREKSEAVRKINREAVNVQRK